MEGMTLVYERWQPTERFGSEYSMTKRIVGITAKMAHELVESGSVDPDGPHDGRIYYREYLDTPIA